MYVGTLDDTDWIKHQNILESRVFRYSYVDVFLFLSNDIKIIISIIVNVTQVGQSNTLKILY